MPSDSSRDRLATALGDDAKNAVMERGYSLGFVGVHSQVRLVQFRLSKKGFSLNAAADDAEFAGMLDEFTAIVTRLLTERWGGIALRVAFDADGELIERLYEIGTLERCDEVVQMSPAKKLAEDEVQFNAQDLLVRASMSSIENWGLFNRSLETDEPRLRSAVDASDSLTE